MLNVDYIMLTKHFSNKTSPEEEVLLKNWLDSNEVNQKTYHRLKRVWLESAAPPIPREVFAERNAWKKVMVKIEAEDLAVKKKLNGRLFYFQNFSIAASILLVLGLIAYKAYFYNPLITTTNETASTQEVTLQDGSLVKLMPKATLSYHKRFSDSLRLVNLEGEAFFNISRNENKPFRVISGDGKTQVLGTSFLIKHSSEEIGLEVATGKVSLGSIKTGLELVVNAGEKVVLKGGVIEKILPPTPPPPPPVKKKMKAKKKKKKVRKVIEPYYDPDVIYIWDGSLK